MLGALHQVERVEGEQLSFEEGSEEVAQVTLVSAQVEESILLLCRMPSQLCTGQDFHL